MISYLNKWIRRTLLLLRWTPIKIKTIAEIFKELENTGIKNK